MRYIKISFGIFMFVLGIAFYWIDSTETVSIWKTILELIESIILIGWGMQFINEGVGARTTITINNKDI